MGRERERTVDIALQRGRLRVAAVSYMLHFYNFVNLCILYLYDLICDDAQGSVHFCWNVLCPFRGFGPTVMVSRRQPLVQLKHVSAAHLFMSRAE